jgi:hypothetical protein
MHVTYAPEDGDRQEWTFEPGRVRSSAAEVMEKRYGDNWDSLVVGIQAGNIRARRVLLWHLLTRQHATLRFEDTPDFFADELTVSFSVAELTALRERTASAKLPADIQEKALAGIDMELDAARKREGATPDAEGKAS